MPLPSSSTRRRALLIAVPAAVLLAVVVGPWLYLNVLRDDPPDRLTFADATTSSTAGGAASSAPDGSAGPTEDIAGTWTVGAGSQAGYRVKEVLFGQDAEAVGRTTEVTGSVTIAGSAVTAVDVTVDMTSVTSDQARRDGQFRGRIMDTADHPTAAFVLTEPIELGPLPASGDERTYTAIGDLTLRGVTRSVRFDVAARRSGAAIEVSATIKVSFDDFAIPDASGGPASVGRTGEVELLLVLTR